MRTILALTFLASACVAEPPPAREDKFEGMAVALVRAGEWMETLDVREFVEDDGTKSNLKHCERTACVKADDEFVWIEITRWQGEAPDDREVTLSKVRRTDGKTVEAWSGKPGGEGTAQKVEPARERKGAPVAGKSQTGIVTKENMKIAGNQIEVQKLEITTLETRDGKEAKMVMTIWVSLQAPFRMRVQDASARDGMFGKVKWDREVEGPAGLVRAEVKSPDWNSTMTVTGTGTDAKATLAVK